MQGKRNRVAKAERAAQVLHTYCRLLQGRWNEPSPTATCTTQGLLIFTTARAAAGPGTTVHPAHTLPLLACGATQGLNPLPSARVDNGSESETRRSAAGRCCWLRCRRCRQQPGAVGRSRRRWRVPTAGSRHWATPPARCRWCPPAGRRGIDRRRRTTRLCISAACRVGSARRRAWQRHQQQWWQQAAQASLPTRAAGLGRQAAHGRRAWRRRPVHWPAAQRQGRPGGTGQRHAWPTGARQRRTWQPATAGARQRCTRQPATAGARWPAATAGE